jgi:heavy metal sensor kinase
MSFEPINLLRFKLRTRILASTTAVLALAMIAAFTWSAVNLRSILEARNDRFLHQKLAELTSALREQATDPTGAALVSELRRESEANAGAGLFAILRHNAEAEFYPDQEMIRATDFKLNQIDPDRNQSALTLGSGSDHVRVIRSGLQNAGGTVWTMDVGLRLLETEVTIRDFHRRLILGGVVFLVLAFVGGVLLTGLSLRPITHSIDTARRLNPDDLSARLPLSGSGDELDQLASTYNTLLDRVAQKHGQLIRFTSDASHELRGPLAALQAAIEVTLQQPRSNEIYRERLESLGEQCHRLTHLVHTLLLLARADAGQISIQQLPVDLALLVRESIDLFQPLADERELILETALPDRLQIPGDRLRLGQLVTNLLDNAIKFTSPNGTIRVKLLSVSGHAELTIADTGIGIDADRLPHIFDRFYRADESRTGGHDAGLGLSICQWIVLAHGGTISASSTPNCGTKFVVRLPL